MWRRTTHLGGLMALLVAVGHPSGASAGSTPDVLLDQLLPPTGTTLIGLADPRSGPPDVVAALALTDGSVLWLRGDIDHLTGYTLVSPDGYLTFGVEFDQDAVEWTLPSRDEIVFRSASEEAASIDLRLWSTDPPIDASFTVDALAGSIVRESVVVPRGLTERVDYGGPTAAFDAVTQTSPLRDEPTFRSRADDWADAGPCLSDLELLWTTMEGACDIVGFSGAGTDKMKMALDAACKRMQLLIDLAVEDEDLSGGALRALAAARLMLSGLCHVGEAGLERLESIRDLAGTFRLSGSDVICVPLFGWADVYELFTGLDAKQRLKGVVCGFFNRCQQRGMIWNDVEARCDCPPGAVRTVAGTCQCENEALVHDRKALECNCGAATASYDPGLETCICDGDATFDEWSRTCDCFAGSEVVQDTCKCPEGTVADHGRGECVPVAGGPTGGGPGGSDLVENTPPDDVETPTSGEEEPVATGPCPGRALNPLTGECTDRCAKTCPPGERPNFVTCRCEPDCGPGMARDADGSCVELCGGHWDPELGCVPVVDPCDECPWGYYLEAFEEDRDPECRPCGEARDIVCDYLARSVEDAMGYMQELMGLMASGSSVLPVPPGAEDGAASVLETLSCSGCNVLAMALDCLQEMDGIGGLGDADAVEQLDAADPYHAEDPYGH